MKTYEELEVEEEAVEPEEKPKRRKDERDLPEGYWEIFQEVTGC